MRMRMRKLSNNAAFLPAALVASRRRKAMDDGLDVDLTVEELSDHLLGTGSQLQGNLHMYKLELHN